MLRPYNIAKWLYLSLFFTILVSPLPAQELKRFNDLIIILDPHVNEKNGQRGALTTAFAIALYQKATPIIVSDSVLKNFIQAKTDQKTVEFADKVGKAIVGKIDQKEIDSIIIDLYNVEVKDEKERESKLDEITKVANNFKLAYIVLDNDNWFCYLHETADLALLIPKAYIHKKAENDWKAIVAYLKSQTKGLDIEQVKKIKDTPFDQKSDPTLIAQAFFQILSDYIKNADSVKAITSLIKQLTSLSPSKNINTNLLAYGCGFDTAKLSPITDVSATELLKTLDRTLIIKSSTIPAIKSMFITSPSKSSEEIKSPDAMWFVAQDFKQSINSQWLIYITGHGSFSRQDDELKLQETNNNIVHFSMVLENSKELVKWTESKKNEYNPILFQKALKNDNDRVTHYEKLVAKYIAEFNDLQKKILPGSFVAESAYVAGLAFNDFIDLLRFFNQGLGGIKESAVKEQKKEKSQQKGSLPPGIDTAFLHYSTCFAGGFNRAFLAQMLNQMNVNFFVASEGVAERGVLSSPLFWIPISVAALGQNKDKYSVTFATL